MNCPACGIDPKYQKPSDEGKVQCTGCGTKFMDMGSR